MPPRSTRSNHRAEGFPFDGARHAVRAEPVVVLHVAERAARRPQALQLVEGVRLDASLAKERGAYLARGGSAAFDEGMEAYRAGVIHFSIKKDFFC